MKALDPVPTDAAWWDSRYRDGQAATVWSDRRLNEILLKELRGAGNVLWPGCGTAFSPSILSRSIPFHFTLTDYSQAALDLAAQSPYAADWEIELLDSEQLPWPYTDAQFDAVVLAELLEYTADPWAIINEAARVGRQVIAALPIGKIVAPGQRWTFSTPEASQIPGFHHLHQLYSGQIVLAVTGRHHG